MKEYLKLLIQNPKNTSEINLAVTIKNKLQFFVVSLLYEADARYYNDFIATVDSLLANPETTVAFRNNFIFPSIVSTEICADICKAWQKVFTATDNILSFQLKDGQTVSDWNGLKESFTQKYMESPMDITAVINGYITDVPINSVKSIELDNDNNILSLLITTDGQKYIYLDPAFQIDFTYKNNAVVITSPIAHGIGFCPASFNSSKMYYKYKLVRINELVEEIERLEKYEIFARLRQMNIPFASYLSMQKYGKVNCGYNEPETNTQCDGQGYLMITTEKGDPVYSTVMIGGKSVIRRCPICGTKPGVGAIITMPYPGKGKDDSVELTTSSMSFIAPPTESLTYTDDLLATERKLIIGRTTGKGSEVNSKVAQNELTYYYSSEGEKTVINTLKIAFEKTLSRIYLAWGKWKYGTNLNKLIFSLGTDFIFSDINTLFEQQTKAKASGLNQILKLDEKIVSYTFGSNPDDVFEAMVWLMVKPNFTYEEASKLPIPDEVRMRALLFYDFYNYIKIEYPQLFADTSDKLKTAKQLNDLFTQFINNYGNSEEQTDDNTEDAGQRRDSVSSNAD